MGRIIPILQVIAIISLKLLLLVLRMHDRYKGLVINYLDGASSREIGLDNFFRGPQVVQYFFRGHMWFSNGSVRSIFPKLSRPDH